MTKKYYFKTEEDAENFVEYASHFGIYSWHGTTVTMININAVIERKLDTMAKFPTLAKELRR